MRDKLIEIILKVAMAHHDDISKQDEDGAGEAADTIIAHLKIDTEKVKNKMCPYCKDKMAIDYIPLDRFDKMVAQNEAVINRISSELTALQSKVMTEQYPQLRKYAGKCEEV